MLASSPLVKNLSEFVTQLSGLLVQLGTVRHVGDQGGGEDILITVGERGALSVDGPHALHGVSIERVQGAVEDGIAADTLGEDLVGFLLGSHVERLKVNGEPWVHGAGLLAGFRSRGNADPFGEVGIGAVLGFDGNGAQGVKGSSVGRANGLDAFLDDQNLDDGLEIIIRHWQGTIIRSKG